MNSWDNKLWTDLTNKKIKRIVHLFIILLLSTVPMLLYGNKLLSPISLDLQTSPLSFLNTVFYAWQSKQALGTSLNAPGWLFPSGAFFSFFSMVGLPNYVVVRLWYIALLFFAGSAMYYYAGSILKNYAAEIQSAGHTNQNEIAQCALIAAIGYIANPYVVLHLNNGHFLLTYAVLPLQLLILDKGLQSGKLYFAALMGLVSLIVTTNLPIVVINYMVILLYIVFYLLSIDKQLIFQKVRFVIISFILISLNLLWFVLPTALPLLNNDPVLANSISQETWQMYGMHSSFSETLRLLGIWPLYGGGFEFSNYYLNNVISIAATYLLPVIALCAAIFMRRSPYIYFLIILLLFSIFMAVGGYASSPFKGMYVSLYEHVPLFSMFRNGYKFVGVIAFVYVMLISSGLFILLNHNLIKKQWVSGALYLSIIALFITSALPLFRGQIFSDSHLAKIPSYWRDTAKYLDDKHGLFRVLLLPDQYFDTYRWGGYGGFISSVPYIEHDVIANSSTKSGNDNIQMLYSPLSRSLNTATHRFDGYVSDQAFCESLGNMSIKYIVQRNDIDYTLYRVSSPDSVKLFLERLDCVKFDKTFGQVDIYKVERESLPRFFISNNNDSEENRDRNESVSHSIEYMKINPTKYRVRIHKAHDSIKLVFNERFDKQWRAYIVPTREIKAGRYSGGIDNKKLDGVLRLSKRNIKLNNYDEDAAENDELTNFIRHGMITSIGETELREKFISKNQHRSIQNDNLPPSHFWETWFPLEIKPFVNGNLNESIDGGLTSRHKGKWDLSETSDERIIEWPVSFHAIANTFANGWLFDRDTLHSVPEAKEGLRGYYIKNIDNSVDFELVIEYRPQRFVYVAYIISTFSIIVCMIIVIFLRKKNHCQNETN